MVTLMAVSTTLFSDIPIAVWVVILPILGGMALKALEKFFNRNVEEDTRNRNYREEINELLTRVDVLEEEVTTWRTKFYEQQETIARLNLKLIHLGGSTTT